jgi:hypothetical protein
VAERLRALLEHPLDPRVARAAVALGCAVLLGFAALIVVTGTGVRPDRPAVRGHSEGSPAIGRPIAARRPPAGIRKPLSARPRQDPQDRPGSPAALRAERELASHRALQHVPYRHGGLSVVLVGAYGGRAVLRVQAATAAAARRGWRRFLRRYRDPGAAYRAEFEGGGRRRG